jgi:hypothetical protein
MMATEERDTMEARDQIEVATIEARLDHLEREVLSLRTHLQTALQPTSPLNEDSWRSIIGSCENDPTFDEAVRLGQDYRRRYPAW